MPEEEQFVWDEAPAKSDPAEAAAPEEPEAQAAEPASGGAPEPAAEAPPAVPEPDSGRKWFIIHTSSGFEQKVAESLRSRAEAFGFDNKVGQILIPTEEVVELRVGRKV